MEPKLVSVIIPAYNATLYIKQAINSVLAQTYRDYEIIVVDDGSTDDTSVVAQQFGGAIRYVHQPNQGLAAARNTGIRMARSEIIALLDADDLWESEFLEVMTAFLEFNPKAGAVYCGFQYIDSQGNNVGKPSLKVVTPEAFYRTQIFVGNWLSACAVLFRKRAAEEVGLFDERLKALEDADLWIRLSELHPFIGLPVALVKYRRHDSNMSKDPQHMIGAQNQVLEKIFGPPDGDVLSWSKSKVIAYRLNFRSAAIRYLASGNIERSAYYLQILADISLDYLCSMEVWRGLARAHIPDEYQFDSSFEFNYARACADIEGLLVELAKESIEHRDLQGRHSKIKASAFLALADEIGRHAELLRACSCLLKAAKCSPQIVLSRPYWGTILRSMASLMHRRKSFRTGGKFLVGVWLISFSSYQKTFQDLS